MTHNITEAFQNTIIDLFDDHKRRHRRIRRDVVTRFLINRWTLNDGSPDPGNDPFWLSVQDAAEPLELSDFVVFLGCGLSPSQPWIVQYNDNVRELLESERKEILMAVAEAAQAWTLVDGRFHPGLSEILHITSDILSYVYTSSEWFDVRRAFAGAIERITSSITQFDPQRDDLITITDLGRAYEQLALFFVRLPTRLDGATKAIFDRSAVGLAAQSYHLLASQDFTSDEARFRARGYLDLIDGAILPWADLAYRIGESTDAIDPIQLAYDRFSLKGLPIAQTMRTDLLHFPLDFDLGSATEVSGDFLTCPMGCYSFSLTLQIATRLADNLRMIGLFSESRQIPSPEPQTPRHLITERYSSEPISSAELEVEEAA